MRKTVTLIVSLLLALTAILTACAGAGNTTATTDLDSLLRVVPADSSPTIMYNDLVLLSEYGGVEKPGKDASIEIKVPWWLSFQDYVMAIHPFPLFTQVWGFDITDVRATLKVSYGSANASLTVLYGDIDTDAFLATLTAYGLTVEEYQGYQVLYGRPQTGTESYDTYMPIAYGVIEDGRHSMLLMSESATGGIAAARALIENAIDAFNSGTSIRDGDSAEARLLGSLGRPAAATMTTEPVPQLSGDQAADMGPGVLQPYEARAMTLTREGDQTHFRFTLAYSSPGPAADNENVLKGRLEQGRSVTLNTELSKVWTVNSVAADGPLLKADVVLSNTAVAKKSLFRDMVNALDYRFLYAGETG